MLLVLKTSVPKRHHGFESHPAWLSKFYYLIMKISRFYSIPFLRKGQVKLSGRNATGKITVRHRGGGHKRAFRIIDWARVSGKGYVRGTEYDPFRNTNLLKLYHPSVTHQKYSYIIAPTEVKLFQELNNYEQSNKKDNNIDEVDTSVKLLRSGDQAPLSFFEAGDFIHNVEAFPGQGPIFARSAGTFCQVRSQVGSSTINTNTANTSLDSLIWSKVRLPSGSQRLISQAAQATLGIVADSPFNLKNQLKAGRSRWKGIRPSVRGVARNPVDHPHGGGQGKTSGGRPSVTFKSWPTKGQPTRSPKRNNKFILTPRKRKNK